MGVEPGNDLRPHSLVGLASDQDAEMLQTDAEFTPIFDDLHILGRGRVKVRLDRGHGCNLIGNIDDRKRGNRQAGRPDQRAPDLQGATAQAVFPVEPPDDLVNQLARERNLVEAQRSIRA